VALEKLAVRALVTFALGPLILVVAWFGGYFFFSLMLAISLLAANEFYTITTKKEVSAQRWLGLLGCASTVAIGFYLEWQLFWQILLVLSLLSLFFELFRNIKNSILNVATTVMGVLYIALPLGLLVSIREMPKVLNVADDILGGKLVILIFLSIWICDSAAYLVGSKIGKHKLFPRVSPNKSVEGTLAGVLFALGTAYFSHLTFLTELSFVPVLVIGAICGILGQISDLVESLFKRDAGVKDSSNLIPGHGGVLDRFDSELLSVPLIYLYLVNFGW